MEDLSCLECLLRREWEDPSIHAEQCRGQIERLQMIYAGTVYFGVSPRASQRIDEVFMDFYAC